MFSGSERLSRSFPFSSFRGTDFAKTVIEVNFCGVLSLKAARVFGNLIDARARLMHWIVKHAPINEIRAGCLNLT